VDDRTKRAKFLDWLAASQPEQRAGDDKHRAEALTDLTRLAQRHHWAGLSLCFAALRYDSGTRWDGFPAADEEDTANLYDLALDIAERAWNRLHATNTLPGFAPAWEASVKAYREMIAEREANLIHWQEQQAHRARHRAVEEALPASGHPTR
jgi:hypothetical protein